MFIALLQIVQIGDNCPTFLAVCYRPPDADRDLASITECFAKMRATGRPFIVCGDFNLPELHWPAYEDPVVMVRSARALQFVESIHVHALTQSVHVPTRGDAVLDLVLSCGGDVDTEVA